MASDNISFGIAVFPWGASGLVPDFGDIIETVEMAEELGFDAVHVPFHLIFPRSAWIFPQFNNECILDAFTMLAALASRTRKIKIAINAIVAPLYHPYVLAKIVSTLDVISSGRVIFGIAPGWIKEEFDIVKAEFDKRGVVTDEYINVIRQLFSQDNVSFRGRFVELNNVKLEPKPIQQPMPPIWIAGGKHSIKRAAKYADYLCLYCKDVRSPQVIQNEISSRLKEESDKEGRSTKLSLYTMGAVLNGKENKQEILKLMQRCYEGSEGKDCMLQLSIVGDSETCVANIRRLVDAGVSYFVLDLNSHGLESVGKIRERMKAFEQVIRQL